MPFRSLPVDGNEQMHYFSSLSGADMVCTIGGRVFGELQALAYSVEREIAPIYTMGSANPRAYSRGKRGISGTLVFQIFDRDSLLEILYLSMKDRNVDIYSAIANMMMQTRYSGHSDSPVFMDRPIHQWGEGFLGPEGVDGDVLPRDPRTFMDEVTPDMLFKQLGQEKIRYVDQVPPFDITISGHSELGLSTTLRILKVQLITEASGTSVDDLTMEKACGFIARDVIPWGYDKIGQQRDNNAPVIGDSARDSG